MAASVGITMGSNDGLSSQDTIHMKLPQKVMVPKPPADAKPRGGKLKVDPQRALEPAKKKLSMVESQRIMAVLLDSIKRSKIVNSIPYIISNLERFRVVLGSELSFALEDHAKTIENFQELRDDTEKIIQRDREAALTARKEKEATEEAQSIELEQAEDQMAERADSKVDESVQNEENVPSISQALSEADDEERPASGASVSSQADMAMRNLALVAHKMQHNCKNILRAFSLNPAAVNAVLKGGNTDQSEETIQMEHYENELKEIMMHHLLTTPVEEMEKNQILKELRDRELHNRGIIHKLESDLNAAEADKEEEIRKKNDIIRKLQSDLHQIEKYSEDMINRTKTEAEKQEAADLKNSEGKKAKLESDVSQLETSLQSLITEHRESEAQLRSKKYKVESEVESWIQKYDSEMMEKQAEYEEIDAIYTEEKKQLNELEERFKTLDEEYQQIMEERRIAREKQEAMERELAMNVSAATTIQAFWRSFKVRKALKSKKKKKGGKKGKKSK